MKRHSEIESQIRDCQIRNLYLDWANQHDLQIEFLKGNKLIRLKLEEVSEFELFEDEFESYYISHLKCLVLDNNEFILSLDPYDERINEIDERDNFKIKFKAYKIEIEEK